MKLEVRQLAELIERNDVGDFSGFGIDPSVASVRRDSGRRFERTMARQAEISF
jgi:hypothetical protein